MFPAMKRTEPMTITLRRSLHRAGRAARRSLPSVMAGVLIIAVLGGTLAGALAL